MSHYTCVLGMSPEVLLSGLVGALLVFVLGALREWWRNERERRGLLRLLLAEIEHNAEVVRTVWESGKPSLIGSPNIRLMTSRTWRDTQARAAQLLPDDLFDESAHADLRRGRGCATEETGTTSVGLRVPLARSCSS